MKLLEDALFLVLENMVAGNVHGRRLAARAPLHNEPGSAGSTGVADRCGTRHIRAGGDHIRAEDFKSVCQALHLFAGEAAIWDTAMLAIAAERE